MSYQPNMFARTWITLADGGSGTYLYTRETAAGSGVWIFLEIMDLADAMGRDAIGGARWSASVAVVDLPSVSPDTLASAIRSCGWFDDMDETEITPIMLAETLHSYGAKSPMWDGGSGIVNERNQYDSPGEEHRPFRDIRAAARREAESLLDSKRRDTVLDTRIVNKLGQTAREYANGADGMWAALRRIQADPNARPEQRLILKVYANAGQTLGCGPVPADLLADADTE